MNRKWKKTFLCRIAAAACILAMLSGTPVCNMTSVQAGTSRLEKQALKIHEKVSQELERWTNEVEKSSTFSDVLRAGKECCFCLLDAKGSVKWSVSDKSVLKIVKKSGNQCVVRALKEGKAVVKASAKNKAATYKVTVKTGEAFVKAWCRQWVKTYIRDGMDDKTKLICASIYVTSYGLFSYGEAYNLEDVISELQGTCLSGSMLLVALYKEMGYEAETRFAAKDDMSRYPANVLFGSDHYNVKVKVKNKTYYIEGTPECGFTYLSTSKKNIYYRSANFFYSLPVDISK